MESGTSPRRYRWPWFVLAALAIGALAAVLWLRVAIERAKERGGYRYDTPITNAVAPR